MHKRPVEPSMQPGRYKTITRPFSWPCRGKYEALGAAQNSNVINGFKHKRFYAIRSVLHGSLGIAPGGLGFPET
jgi:hypothetical protein